MSSTGDTIAAIATAPGMGAIGIVRLSGPGAVRALSAVFRPEGGRPLEEHGPRRLVYGTLLGPEGSAIDQALEGKIRLRKPLDRGI